MAERLKTLYQQEIAPKLVNRISILKILIKFRVFKKL